MYNLNKFCNIIASLRKERGWTQTMLADKIGISPQSVSKWECGIGFPDVTLFPVIADLFDVSVNILFGESNNKEIYKMNININNERKFIFEPLSSIDIRIGNTCRIEIIDGERENSLLNVKGDATFIEFFAVEKENGRLCISAKNPTGSDIYWTPYDRGGYQNDNIIQIHTGVASSDCTITNYLNLSLNQITSGSNSYTWICK